MPDAPKTATQLPQRNHNEDRMRRADSWLRRSEVAKDDTEKFIFLWIAFNAAYGQGSLSSDSDPQPAERERFKNFLRAALDSDDGKTLEKVLWRTCSRSVRRLLRNPYVFAPFWYEVQGLPTGRNWKKNFDSLNESVDRAKDKDAHYVLGEVFLRLYTLRNQILHGGATFGIGWGQRQVKDGRKIMASLVPAILDIMRTDIGKKPDSDIWGMVLYPRIGDAPG